jgi:hypothetical protein
MAAVYVNGNNVFQAIQLTLEAGNTIRENLNSKVNAIDLNNLTNEQICNRAVIDASLFLAFISENGVHKQSNTIITSVPNICLLSLYSIPLLTISESIFNVILDKFLLPFVKKNPNLDATKIETNKKKKILFLNNILTSIIHDTIGSEKIMITLKNETSRNNFILQLCTEFNKKGI